MIVVTGATGHIGGELVRLLSDKGVTLRAVTRDPRRTPPLPGVAWVQADLRDARSLRDVFLGAETMFLLTSNAEDMGTLQRNAIEAAGSAGVAYVVKGSALGASSRSRSPIGRSHYEVETVLQGSGMAWTILRPHVFMQNLLDAAPTIAREGTVRAASGEGKIPFIDAKDIAAVAAAVLTTPGHQSRKYVLTGPEALSYGDVARILSEATGRRVEYAAESAEGAEARLVAEGASRWMIESALALAAYQREGGPTAVVSPAVKEILGRPPRSFREFVRDHVSAFRGA